MWGEISYFKLCENLRDKHHAYPLAYNGSDITCLLTHQSPIPALKPLFVNTVLDDSSKIVSNAKPTRSLQATASQAPSLAPTSSSPSSSSSSSSSAPIPAASALDYIQSLVIPVKIAKELRKLVKTEIWIVFPKPQTLEH